MCGELVDRNQELEGNSAAISRNGGVPPAGMMTIISSLDNPSDRQQVVPKTITGCALLTCLPAGFSHVKSGAVSAAPFRRPGLGTSGRRVGDGSAARSAAIGASRLMKKLTVHVILPLDAELPRRALGD